MVSAMKSKLMRKKASRTGPSDAAKITAPRERIAADQLKWKTVKNGAAFSGLDEGGGMMMLEELDDVDVEWNEDASGRKIAKFVAALPSTRQKGKGKAKPIAEAEDEEQWGGIPESPKSSVIGMDNLDEDASEDEDDEGDLPTFSGLQAEDMDEEDDEDPIPDEEAFNDNLLPEWAELDLHTALKRALLSLDFLKPTDIQRRTLQPGLTRRDVVGVAETGSGKTLAYSLPVLSYLLRQPLPKASTRRPLSALILCPTRELAIQVVDHVQKVIQPALDRDKKGPPRISIGSVVGGLSAQKQKRIVERGCDILVATPGRLWDLIKTDDGLAAGIRSLRFLIIDEADRMIENGHFAELENIVKLTQRNTSATLGPDDDDPVFAAASLDDQPARDDMQTFVFSATLSKDLQQNLKKRYRPIANKKKGGKKASALEDLVEKLDFRDENPEVIDLSPEGGVVKMLKESMVECVITEKDLYLYYFLLRYPGRSIVFVGSIDGIRRLIPLFETLQMPIFPLHSQLQQKQRLKNLDRFKSNPNGVLIATDVAARGLDLPNVEHVIHFNLPRTADAYIHRSGRTARAQNPGFALQLCAPEEKGMQRALMKSLGRSAELPELPIESGFLPKLTERIRIARDIEKAQHNVKKENHARNWLKEAAEAMDLDIDPSLLSDEEDPDAPTHRKQNSRTAKKAAKVPALKAELRELLAEPLMARGVSARYPTSGSKIIIDDMLNDSGHGQMLGASTKKAYDEVHKARPKSLVAQKRKRTSAKQ